MSIMYSGMSGGGRRDFDSVESETEHGSGFEGSR